MREVSFQSRKYSSRDAFHLQQVGIDLQREIK